MAWRQAGRLDRQELPHPLQQAHHSAARCTEASRIPVEEISQLVGHRGTTVTELVYRHQLRPVIQAGATIMDRLFKRGSDA
jgi:hypothetical protein